MTYMEQFTDSQIKAAFEELRPDFRERLFVDGMEQAKPFAMQAAGLIYPGTDCFVEHYRTCFEFYITYAFARLTGWDDARSTASCMTKYGTLPPVIFQAVTELCRACFYRSFPTMREEKS